MLFSPAHFKRAMRILIFPLFAAAACLGVAASVAMAHGDDGGPLPHHGRLPGQPDFKRVGKTSYRFLPHREEYEVHHEGRPPAYAHVDYASEGLHAGPNSPLPTKEDAPICRSSGHRIVIVYTHRPSDTTPTPTTLLRSIVNRMNWKIVQQSSLSSGGSRSVQMVLDCSAGLVSVHDVATSKNTLSTLAPAVKAALGDPTEANAVKYLAFDAEELPGGEATGIAEAQDDASKSFTNRSAIFSEVAIAYDGIWETHVPMHELFHTLGATQGAVSEFAPFSTYGGHCNDGLDILCYDDNSLHSDYSSEVCPASEGYDQPEKTPIDCNYDTYFNAAPKAGSWLAGHWNTGGEEDPFLVNESDVLLKVAGGSVSRLGDGEAVVRGTIYAGGSLPTSYRFEYGTTTSLGSSAPVSPASVAAGPKGSEVEATLSGLVPNTTYYFRLGASNSNGSVHGQTSSFTSTRWTIRATPAGSVAERFTDVSCATRSACVGVGIGIGSSVESLVEWWDGNEWAKQSTSGPGGTLRAASCGTPTACMAVGSELFGVHPYAERKNGSGWTVVAVPAPTDALREVGLYGASCVSASSCVAVGRYVSEVAPEEAGEEEAGEEEGVEEPEEGEPEEPSEEEGEEEEGEEEVPVETRALIAAWDGSSWSLLPSPRPVGAAGYSLKGVSCTAANACIAVGAMEDASGHTTPLAERWNGETWSLQTTPTQPSGSRLEDISCVSASNCVAVGTKMGSNQQLAERWNGSTWTEKSPGGQGLLSSVSCSTASACMAVYGGTMKALSWDGEQWHSSDLSAPAGPSRSVSAVSCATADDCLAVGNFTPPAETKTRPLAEHLDPYVAPAAVTSAATSVTPSTATINASVDPNGWATQYQFEYGTTSSYGSKTPGAAKAIGSGVSDVEVSEALSGLAQGTTYHYRVVATNAAGKATGEDRTFTTPLKAPSAKTGPATQVGPEGANLRGTVNPNGVAIAFHFEYGPTTSYGSSAPSPSKYFGPVTRDVDVANSIGGLQPNSTYHFRVVASGEGGTAYGEDQSFTTDPAPEMNAEALGSLYTWSDVSRASAVSCSATEYPACTVVGDYEDEGGAEYAFGGYYDGGFSSLEPTPVPSGAKASSLRDVTCSDAGICVAVGSYVNGSGVTLPMVARLSGSGWALQTVPLPAGAASGEFLGVACFAGSTKNHECVAVGSYVNPWGEKTDLIEGWYGGKWAPEPTEEFYGGELTGVACPTTRFCVAVGSEYDETVEETQPLWVTWDGSDTSGKPAEDFWESRYLNLYDEYPNVSGGEWSAVACESAESCTAVGSYVDATGGRHSLSEIFLSHADDWFRDAIGEPVGALASRLRDVSCLESGKCLAVGSYVDGLGVPRTLAASSDSDSSPWNENGNIWAIDPTPDPEEATSSELNGLSSCASGSMCMAVGAMRGGAATEAPMALSLPE